MKVGLESISLDSWSRLIQYNMFREVLGSGMTSHIQGNELLREIFQMGPAPLTTVESKASRLERVGRAAQMVVVITCTINCK